MSRGVPFGILLALVIATGAGGYSFLDLGLGGPVYTGSARGSSMGEVGWLTEENSLSTFLNPATLGILDSPDVTLAYQYNFLHETRAFPAYDSFDALLGYNVYASNKNFYQNVALGFATGVLPRARGLSFGIAYSPVYDLNYDYEEEVRDRSTSSQPADKVIANAYQLSDGSLKAVSFGVARALAREASLGASLDYVFGSYDIVTRIAWADGRPETRDAFSASNLSGVRFRLGGRIKVGNRLEMGFEGTTRCVMEGDFSAETEGAALSIDGVETVYPSSFGVGVRFRPRNELTGLLEVGMKYTAWSEYSNDFYGDVGLEDIFTWHVGVEHVFYNGTPLRLGFLYGPSPSDKDIAKAAFTFGTGYAAYGWTVDFSGQIGWAKYRDPDIFDNEIFGVPSDEPGVRWRDEVNETTFGGRLSFARRL